MKKLKHRGYELILRKYFLLIGFFVFVRILVASDIAPITQKDQLAFDMLTCLRLFDTCKNMEAESKQFMLRNLDNTSDLEDEMKNPPMYVGYQKELSKKIKDLLVSYSKTKCGLSRQNFWQIYNQCSSMAKKIIPRKSLANFFAQVIEEQSLMGLAQKMVTAEAAKSHDENFKLLTLFRDNNASNFQKLLNDSFTLYIPMARAYKKTNSKNSNSFMKNLVDELKKGYWHDDDFVAVMHYIYQYIIYEFSVAKSDPYWIKTYPLLKLVEPNDLARQLLAHFVYLYVISPFLMDRIPLNVIKKFASTEGLLINYDSKEKPPQFSDVAPSWNEFINLITGKSKSKLGTRSLKGKNKSLRTISSRIFYESSSISSEVNDLSTIDTIEDLIDCHKDFLHDSTIKPDFLTTEKKLVEMIVKMSEGAFFRKIIAEFYLLQETIRKTNNYSPPTKNNNCYGLASSILTKMENAGTWHDLIILFEALVNVSDEYSNDRLNTVVLQLAQMLTDAMYHLGEEELRKLLQLLSRLRNHDLFNRLYQFVLTTADISNDPNDLHIFLCSFPAHISFEVAHYSPRPRTSWASRRKSTVFKYYDKQIKISWPKIGVKERIKALRQNLAFKDAPLEILTMVARIGVMRRMEKNEVLYKKGAPVKSLVLITDGELESTMGDDPHYEVQILSKGQFINQEMSVFDNNALHRSTVIATKSTDIYEIPVTKFHKLLEANAAMLKKLVQNLAFMVYRQEQRLKELKIPKTNNESLFGKLLNEKDLVAISTLKSLDEHEILSNEDSKARELYWVERGSVFTGPNYETEIKTGHYLDEAAFFAKKYRLFSAKVGSNGCSVISYSCPKFYDIAIKKPILLTQMAMELIKNFNNNNVILYETDSYNLMRAIEEGNFEKMVKFVDLGVDINAACPIEKNMTLGSRPIHVAARYKQIKILDYLLNRGANVDIQDDLGNTAAHFAAHYDSLEIFQTLKNYGANLWLENNDQETPFEIADLASHKRIVDFLRSN